MYLSVRIFTYLNTKRVDDFREGFSLLDTHLCTGVTHVALYVMYYIDTVDYLGMKYLCTNEAYFSTLWELCCPRKSNKSVHCTRSIAERACMGCYFANTRYSASVLFRGVWSDQD